MIRSQTASDKTRSQEGKSPDRRLRSRICAKWTRKYLFKNNQDVGSEAAIIKRVRKSSLVENECTEDIRG